jgi:hypothetical protein
MYGTLTWASDYFGVLYANIRYEHPIVVRLDAEKSVEMYNVQRLLGFGRTVKRFCSRVRPPPVLFFYLLELLVKTVAVQQSKY